MVSSFELVPYTITVTSFEFVFEYLLLLLSIPFIISSSSCIDLDTDGDGTPNRLDLDSDGDGCADAVEAGSSTTATSTSAYPTGTDTNTNGLLNNYEGTTAGTINYTSTYTDFALINAVNACTDTDADGITDVIDIDDDNDGVLDTVESPCAASLPIPAPTIAGAIADAPSLNSAITYKSISGTQSKAVNQALAYGTTDVVNFSGATGAFSVEFANPLANLDFALADLDQSEAGYLQIYDQDNNLVVLTANNIAFIGSGVTFTPGTTNSGSFTSSGFDNAINSTVNYVRFKFNALTQIKKINIYKTAGANNTWLAFNAACNLLDTDGDGTPNRLDTDSDGDGISDGVEDTDKDGVVDAGESKADAATLFDK
jgi:hypothetical protein